MSQFMHTLYNTPPAHMPPPVSGISSTAMTGVLAVLATLLIVTVSACICWTCRQHQLALNRQGAGKDPSTQGRYRLRDWDLKRVVVVVHPDNTPICAQRSDIAKASAAPLGKPADEEEGPAAAPPFPPAEHASVAGMANWRSIMDDGAFVGKKEEVGRGHTGPRKLDKRPPIITADISWHGLPIVRNLLAATGFSKDSGPLAPSPRSPRVPHLSRQASARSSPGEDLQHNEKPD